MLNNSQQYHNPVNFAAAHNKNQMMQSFPKIKNWDSVGCTRVTEIPNPTAKDNKTNNANKLL